MRQFPKGLVPRIPGGKAGFTLVELLVVVGIIVALAAVIVPSVIQFAGKGETGAKAAESNNVQTAIDTLMTDVSITTVTGRVSPALSNADFTSLDFNPGSATTLLSTYLRQPTTKYFYCWSTAGLVTRQDTVATTCP